MNMGFVSLFDINTSNDAFGMKQLSNIWSYNQTLLKLNVSK